MTTFAFSDNANLIDFFNYIKQNPISKRFFWRNFLLSLSTEKYRLAGVLVGFYYETEIAEYSIILTQRSAQLKEHANQIAFPGGKKEHFDDSLVATALRETNEEIGVATEHIKTFTTIKKIRTPTNYLIYPTLAIVNELSSTQNNSLEVTETFLIPISLALDPKKYQFKKVYWKHFPISTVSINYGEKYIWGVTAEILFYLAEKYRLFLKKQIQTN